MDTCSDLTELDTYSPCRGGEGEILIAVRHWLLCLNSRAFQMFHF